MVTLNKQGILMNDIVRIETNQRMSRVVKAAGLVFVGGQTSNDRTLDVKGQTQQVLAKIDGYLAQAGIDKTRLGAAPGWPAGIGRGFPGVDRGGDAWGRAGCAAAPRAGGG